MTTIIYYEIKKSCHDGQHENVIESGWSNTENIYDITNKFKFNYNKVGFKNNTIIMKDFFNIYSLEINVFDYNNEKSENIIKDLYKKL